MAKYKAYFDEIEKIYKSTYTVGVLEIKPVVKFTSLEQPSSAKRETRYTSSKVTLTRPNGQTDIIMATSLSGVSDPNLLDPVTISLDSLGSYILNYSGSNSLWFLDGSAAPSTISYSFSYNFSVVENRLPLKKWTIATVINRLLDLAEPIRKGEKLRFKLNAEQAEKFEKILAPQFSFTKQTLRECLQEVGKVVHGEPRLTPKKDEDGKWYYEVSYDLYTSQDDSGIRYVQSSLSQVRTQIESYLSHIDSSAENLVNQLDKFSGVIVEPYRGGAKTVRQY